MEEGGGPPSTPTPPYQSPRNAFDPISLLYNAISYGEAVWSHIHNSAVCATPLVNLSYIIEDQLQTLIEFCTSPPFNIPSDPIILSLIKFYTAPELHIRKNHILPRPLVDQIRASVSPSPPSIWNYFASLYEPDSNEFQPKQIMASVSSISNQAPSQNSKSFFVEDLAVSEITDIVRNQMDQDKQAIDTDTTGDMPVQTATQDPPVSQRLRVNLIRHRFARSSDMTTLKLFKSFATALRAADKEITILPYDSKKQRYTSIVSSKQVEKLNEHELKLYFQPWHKEQHYSLSGFFHLNSTIPFQELFTEAPIAQWLDTYQYSVKLCPSQTEEMAVIGSLCYGSLWMYREDLKQHIMNHQEWKKANPDPDHPMIFDLIVRQFRGSKRNTQMIFVTGERSKQEEIREVFKLIYDGTPKSYPRGEMMLFIPTRNGEQYSNEQREKIIYNHEQYLGEEEIMAIHGLQDLNTQVLLKGGKSTSIRTLLKSMPATAGMSRSTLFQVVDPNAGQTCTIVSFQKNDRSYVEKRKETLEKELRAVLAPGESENVFQSDEDGIWFGGHVRVRNGKPIALSVPHKADLEYIQRAESRLKTPTSKRAIAATTTNHHYSRPPSQITYSGNLQARTSTTQQVSVQETEGTTTTTTTQTQTVTATMEARFQVLETEMRSQREHQCTMDQRLSQLENRTGSINDNIAAMMAHWQITPSQKRRAVSVLHTQDHHVTQTMPLAGDGGASHNAGSEIMDVGDMEE